MRLLGLSVLLAFFAAAAWETYVPPGGRSERAGGIARVERPPSQALQVQDRLSARLVRVIDGDTFVLWVARFGTFESRATIDHYRLDGWRARELHQGPETAPDGSIIRYDGQTARQAAANLLGTASKIEVEERTLDGFGRIVAGVLVDGKSLGVLLEEKRMVTPGSTMGAVEPQERPAAGAPGSEIGQPVSPRERPA